MRSAPHPFTLRQLQYAVAVAEELSFRKAAARCRVAQPSLSSQLAQLEEALGTKLFERDKKRVIPTEAGRDLVGRAKVLLLAADDLLDAGKRASDPFSGVARIGVIPTVSPYLLPAAAPRLKSTFPRLTIAWREDKTAALAAALHEGEIDAALLALEAAIGDVEADVVAVDPFVLAASSDHALVQERAPLDAGRLKGESIMLLDDGHCFREQALEVCSSRARESEFRATSLNTLVQMVAAGTGVTLLPALSVPTEANRANLRVRPIASPKAHRTIALVFRRRSPRAEALHAIARVLRDVYPADETKVAVRRKRARRRPS